MTQTSEQQAAPEPAEYPPNVLGASAVFLSLVGVFFFMTFGVASLLGIALGFASLVRSRLHRGQKGGVGIVAMALGFVGLIVTAFVIVRSITIH